MKKRIILPLSLGILAMASSITVCAAPQIMADGTIFDAAFYAQTYPDIVSAYGTNNADVMYQHYVKYGKAEGRLAVSSAEMPVDKAPEPDESLQPTATGYSVERLEIGNDTSKIWKTVYTRDEPNGTWQQQWDGDGIGEGMTCVLHNHNLTSSYFGVKVINTDGTEMIFETNNIIPGQNYHEELLDENNGFYTGEGLQNLTLWTNDYAYKNACTIYAINWF